MDLTEVGWEGMGGINLAQDMEQWWAVESTILKVLAVNFLTDYASAAL
jgi:hypothetical protein